MPAAKKAWCFGEFAPQWPLVGIEPVRIRSISLNGRGAKSYPNPNGPNSLAQTQPVQRGFESAGYVAHLETGAASVIVSLDSTSLRDLTKTVFRNSPYSHRKLGFGAETDAAQQPQSPVQYILYVVKENRTYDEVLGDLGKGNGDPKLSIFGERVTPNHHKLTREYVLFDNFYTNGDVDADGQSWSTSAIA